MAHYELVRPARGSWWQRAKRSITLGPFNPKDREIARIFGGAPASAGVRVDEESSMSFSGVWSAVVGISNDVAKVPLPLYKRLGDGGREQYRDHQLYELMHDEPNEEMSSFVFRRTMQGHVLVWGNGYGEIERDFSGRPVAIWPMMPWAVTPFRDGGRLRYRVMQPSGGEIYFERRDVLHLSGIGLDGISGYPPIRKAMESIGLALAAERFGGAFFGNGATFGGIIKYPAGITTTPQTREENRKVIEKRHQGVDRSHRLLTLYEGAEYQQMGIPPEQAQFLETRRFQIEEVARWFNIPVHKLKELQRTSYNSIEHQSIEYATDTLQPWFRMWEGELRLKLIPRLERKLQFFEHITEALTRGDSAAQSELASKLFSVGAITPNGIAAKFNMNPNPNGNDIYVPSNTMPADLARKYWEAQIKEAEAKAKQAERPPVEPKPEGGGEKDTEVKSLQEQLALARHAASLAEEVRDAAKVEAERERVARELVATARETDKGFAADALEQATRARREADERALALLAERDAAVAESQVVFAQMAERGRLLVRTETERDEATAALTMANTSLHDAASRERALNELCVQADLDRDAARNDSSEARQQCAMLLEKVSAAEVQLASVSEVLALANTSLHDAASREQALAVERDAAMALADEAVVERDTVKAQAKDLCAKLDERDAQLVEARGILNVTTTQAVAVTQERDTLTADAEALRTDLARARADLATELDTQQKQKAVTLAAMRSLFVDASERLLQKESDRARKHQTTPEKLRAWVDTFYPMHVETVRSAFRPLVGAWTAVAGGESNGLLERLVSEHIEASKQALALVLDVDDEDMRASALERTLRRWEEERAEAMADALVREGMAR